MGGKGRRRREKNYRAAHGGHTRLPPPPDPSQLDALPLKLRKIMSFTSHHDDGSGKPSNFIEEKRRQRGRDAEKKIPPEETITSEATSIEGDNGDIITSEQMNENGGKRRKKKRKRNQANDLRFETLMDKTKSSEKKRERKKKYLESKKKKHQNLKTEDNLDFPGRELIKFGDVVQAPPKLVALPKVPKKFSDASRERVRLQAIDTYRKRRGWTSRPGLQLPTVNAAASL